MKYIGIKEAAEMLNVSIDTLRRWDKAGILKSIRFTPAGHRHYSINDINLFLSDLFAMARNWVARADPAEPRSEYYCKDASIFQARLQKLEHRLQSQKDLEKEFSLITSIVGEIGNNSFDHNLGSWTDIRGIMFAYDISKKQIVLADRGQGVLATLRRVRPALKNDEEALKVAFTEKISGRAPESRGNGLKYVRSIVVDTPKSFLLQLSFQSGSAHLNLKEGDKDLQIDTADSVFSGCLVYINYYSK